VGPAQTAAGTAGDGGQRGRAAGWRPSTHVRLHRTHERARSGLSSGHGRERGSCPSNFWTFLLLTQKPRFEPTGSRNGTSNIVWLIFKVTLLTLGLSVSCSNVADSSDELHSGRRPALAPAASEETIQKTCGVCKRSVSFVVRASHLDEPPVNAVPKWLKVNPRRLVTAMVIVLAILTSGGAVSSLLYKDST
jgi:hypothetical protein